MVRVQHFLIFFLFFCNSTYSQQSQKAYADSLTTLIKTTKVDTVKVEATVKLAAAYRYNQPDTALIISRQAFAVAKKANFQKGIADSYHVMASAYTNKGNYDSALFYSKKSLFIRERRGDKKGISTSNNNIGLIYFNQGAYEKAVKYYLISSKMDEELNDKDGMATSFNNIGIIYMNQSNFEKAMEYYSMALEVYENDGKKFGIAGAHANIGGVYYYQKKWKECIEEFKRSLLIYEEINNERFIATMCTNLGEVYAEVRQYREAMENIRKAISIQIKLGDNSGLCYSYLALAKLQIVTKSFIAAEGSLLEVKRIAEQINAKKQLSAALQMLSGVYANTNKYKEAYQMYNRFTAINDSLLNSENVEKVAEIASKYETDRKSREIELLKKQKEIQALRQTAETAQNKMVRNSLIGGFIVLLFIAALIYNRYKIKQKANLLLHQKNVDIQTAKEKIELQANELSVKNKEITDSIRYAKRIQTAILPPVDQLKKALTDYFVLYKPKDIVSGDFYWLQERGDLVLVAAVDCTGHGVPGALMSVVGSSSLDQISIEDTKPDVILDKLNKTISVNLQQRSQDVWLKDGMDIALCLIDRKKMKLTFSGAMNSGYVIRNKQAHELEADKITIGTWGELPGQNYTAKEYDLKKGDMIYLFTDGYGDQFGGPKGKKFRTKQLIELCCEISNQPTEIQKQRLNETFEAWRGDMEQIDDVSVIGIRI